MKARKLQGAVGALCLLGLSLASGTGRAADTRVASTPRPESSAPATSNPPPPGTNQSPVLYKPRSTGLKRQVNAGSRGVNTPAVVLAVMSPEGLGLASGNQPALWWYLSETSPDKIEFTLNHDSKTLVKITLPEPAAAGLHRIDLARLPSSAPIRLERDTPYQWTVRLRSGDDPAVQPVSIGWIEWTIPKTEFAKQVAEAPPGLRPSRYAGEGYWYDAVDPLASAVAQNPADAQARAQLQSLLDQTGLKEVHLPGSPAAAEIRTR